MNDLITSKLNNFIDKNTNTTDRPGVRVSLYSRKIDYTKKHEKQNVLVSL